MMPEKCFAEEGGKLHLAEALFFRHKFQIRCPKCVGNPNRPGFIKDEAGKGDKEGRPRRQWACQRSNSKGSLYRCPRISCGEYINLARQDLDQQQFQKVLQPVSQRYPPSQEAYAILQTYDLTAHPFETKAASPRPRTTSAECVAYANSLTTSSTSPRTTDRKRKTIEEESAVPIKRIQLESITESARSEPVDPPSHRQVDPFLTSNEISRSLKKALYLLDDLVQIGQDWKEQQQSITLFLQSSSPILHEIPSSSLPSPRLNTDTTRFSTIDETFPRTRSEMKSIDTTSTSSTASGLEVTISDIDRSEKTTASSPVSDRTIPCTESEGFRSSSPPKASQERSRIQDESIATESPAEDRIKSESDQASLSNPSLLKRAKALVERFEQVHSQQVDESIKIQHRRQLRQRAKAEGIYTQFQQILSFRHIRSNPITLVSSSVK